MLLSWHNDHRDAISYASIKKPDLPTSEKKGNKRNTVRALLLARCKQNVTIRRKPPSDAHDFTQTGLQDVTLRRNVSDNLENAIAP